MTMRVTAQSAPVPMEAVAEGRQQFHTVLAVCGATHPMLALTFLGDEHAEPTLAEVSRAREARPPWGATRGETEPTAPAMLDMAAPESRIGRYVPAGMPAETTVLNRCALVRGTRKPK